VFRLWSGYALPSPEHTPSPLILIDAEALKLIVAQQAMIAWSVRSAVALLLIGLAYRLDLITRLKH
jgi:hypothetical protein